MGRRSALPLGLLVVNLGLAVSAPSRSARLLAVLGCLLAVLMLVLPWRSAAVRAYLEAGLPAIAGWKALVVPLLPFLLPLVAGWLVPPLALGPVDARLQIAVAWLLFVIALWVVRGSSGDVTRADPPGRSSRLPPLTLLFVIWTCVLWLAVVWGLGVGRIVVDVDRSVARPCRTDGLTWTFRHWEAHPASEHLFLAWRDAESFDARTPYVHHSHAYLLLMYASVEAVQGITGAALHVGSNVIPFLYAVALAAAFCVLVYRSRRVSQGGGLLAHLWLFLGLGFLLTQWRFWRDLYSYGSDATYPLAACLFVALWACLQRPRWKSAAILSAAAITALSPLQAPILLLALACVFGKRRSDLRSTLAANRTLIQISGVSLAVAGLFYVTPWLLAAWKGYQASGSSYLFRSGLDGDTSYLSGVLQAFAQPCSVCCGGGRALRDLVFPAFVPLAICWLWMLRRSRAAGLGMFAQFAFLTSPYFFALVLFPQSVSVHPYLYDQLLIVPAATMGSWAVLLEPVQRRLRGATLLAALLLMVGLIMSNLIGIAQWATRVPP